MHLTEEELTEIHNKNLREPSDVLGFNSLNEKVLKQSLVYKIEGDFVKVLEKLKITLFATREYEHLIMALNVKSGKLNQSFLTLPHPSGLVINRKTSSCYIAATRNPNQIWEFKPVKNYLKRDDLKVTKAPQAIFMPSLVKYIPGASYVHDIAFIGNKLYANSVGQNTIIEIDFKKHAYSKPLWWPKCIEDNTKKPKTNLNYIQLNSIAPGKTLRDSYFSASADKITNLRPGHPDYKVDKLGVIFSGKTREVFATGLTRPHSARIYKGKVWVDNSGYGEFGYVKNNKFVPVVKLPGWTRGLCFVDNIAFIGFSKVLTKFKSYAPGLKGNEKGCGVVAFDMNTNKILGSIKWPAGNQIFAIDWCAKNISTGFIFNDAEISADFYKTLFYSYVIV